MSVWKPKIWSSGSMWICSYYRNSRAGAYAAWKGRDELRKRILKEE